VHVCHQRQVRVFPKVLAARQYSLYPFLRCWQQRGALAMLPTPHDRHRQLLSRRLCLASLSGDRGRLWDRPAQHS
jgi:hypothetical protein